MYPSEFWVTKALTTLKSGATSGQMHHMSNKQRVHLDICRVVLK